MTILVSTVLITLLVSFLCSLAEATVLSLTPSQVAQLAEKNPTLGATWQRLKRSIERPIAVILMLNTGTHTIGATIAGAELERLFGGGVILFSIGFAFVMLQFAELLPKTIGVRFNKDVATVIGPPLEILVRALTPLVDLAHWLNRPFHRSVPSDGSPTVHELTALAALARLSNVITPHQERIIRGAARLSRLTAQETMIRADQVTFLSLEQSIADALITAHLDPHTRFPVIEGQDKNRVVGYVNFKEVVYSLRMNPTDPSLRGVLRPVRFVAPRQPLSELLRLFVEQHEHMAIVQDAAGQILGLLTLEDVVEELLGELEDEFDRLPRMIHSLGGSTWLIGGGVTMAEVAAQVGPAKERPSQPPQPHNGVGPTISAWMIDRLGRVPRPGEILREEGLELAVRRTRRGQVFEVQLTRISAPSSA